MRYQISEPRALDVLFLFTTNRTEETWTLKILAYAKEKNYVVSVETTFLAINRCRLSNPSPGAFIIVLTRWHIDYTSGF